jgi:dihydroorotate dehydrogenase (fumarate)
MSTMDLSTRYLGLELRSPLVPSASPLSESLDNIRRMEDEGAGAVVLHSLFEEQLTHAGLELDHYLQYGSDSHGEALSYFPDSDNYLLGPDAYLAHLTAASKAVEMPVIASLNGVSPGGWTSMARQMQDAGAAALELNPYFIQADPTVSATDVESMYSDVVQQVCERVSIPVAVKLNPFFSALPHFCARLVNAGASGLVLFNRFYQPDFDLVHLEVVPRVHLSTAAELRLPLRWIAIMFGRVDADFALTTGVHTHEDVIKALMAGAQVTMVASELLRSGIGRIGDMMEATRAWLVERGYDSLAQCIGSMSQQNVANPGAFERANYLKTLQSWSHDPAALSP